VSARFLRLLTDGSGYASVGLDRIALAPTVDTSQPLRYVCGMPFKRAVLCFVIGLSSLARSIFADDWPRWRGPELNGISKETNWSLSWPVEGPKQLWKRSVGTGFSSVAVAQGQLFTLGNKNETDTVYAFDAETGKEIWKHSYPCALEPIYYEGGPGSTPTVEGNNVYTLSKQGDLFCFEAATGKIVWQKNLMEELGVAKPRWGFAGSPLIEENRVIVNVGGAGTAVDKATGKLLWKSDTNAAGYATPIPYTMSGERCVAIFSGHAVVGVRVKDGKEQWRYPWEERWGLNAADPLLIADNLFASSFGRGCALLRLTASAPSVLWENKHLAHHFNCGVHLNGFIYGIHGNSDEPTKDLRCIDVATGEVKWKTTGFGLGSIMSADGKLLVFSDRGELVIGPASPMEFKPIARAQVLGGKCWTVPVLANGRIYCRNAEGTLICLDVRNSRSR
jgi:outer membrane protein assembly factor BamB